MKLYNPFKWHISRIGKFYYIRRLRLFGWQYLDRKYGFVWSFNHNAYRYCRMPTLQEAEDLLDSVTEFGFVKQ